MLKRTHIFTNLVPVCAPDLFFTNAPCITRYGHSSKFLDAVAEVVEVIKGQLLEQLQILNTSQARQIVVACAMFNCIACHGDLSKPKVARLLSNLWGLIEKAGASSKTKSKSVAIVSTLADKGVPGASELLSKLY